jgi:hypothetical protein
VQLVRGSCWLSKPPTALSRRYRGVFALLLSLLLFGMQQEAFRHALTHFRPAVAHQELSNPQADAPCVECALLAAGSAALPSDAPAFSASPGFYVTTLPAPVAPTRSLDSTFTQPRRPRFPDVLSARHPVRWRSTIHALEGAQSCLDPLGWRRVGAGLHTAVLCARGD